MQNFPDEALLHTEDDLALQTYFKAGIAPDDVAAVYPLKRAQPLFQAFSALFHGGISSVMLRLLVLRELTADVQSPAFSRADINLKLAFLEPDALETVVNRLRSTGLLVWDAQHAVYRIAPVARNLLAAIETLLQTSEDSDQADMGFMLAQVAGAQQIGGVAVEQLHHLLGRLIELTEEFSDAIASGSEFQLRAAQKKWHTACDWVEKGSQIILTITHDEGADAATHKAAQAIGRAQSALLNMQGMFSRALNQIERQRVHLGQSGLSTTDIKTWLLQKEDLAALADGALAQPVTPLFITPAEMIDVAESELLAHKAQAISAVLPSGENVRAISQDDDDTMHELEHWLARLAVIEQDIQMQEQGLPLHESLLPADFAVASYRASMLPLLGDENEATLQGATGTLARLPISLQVHDKLQKLQDPAVAAMSKAFFVASSALPLPTKVLDLGAKPRGRNKSKAAAAGVAKTSESASVPQHDTSSAVPDEHHLSANLMTADAELAGALPTELSNPQSEQMPAQIPAQAESAAANTITQADTE